MTHVVAVDEIDRVVLSCAYDQMRVGPRLIRQQQWPYSSKVKIGCVNAGLIVGSEIIEDCPSRVDLYNAVSVIFSVSAIGAEPAVTSNDVDIEPAAPFSLNVSDATGKMTILRASRSSRLWVRRPDRWPLPHTR